MRINGQFTYYHKIRLQLIDKRKEFKYVSKTVRGEDGEIIVVASKGKEMGMGIGVTVFGLAVTGGGIYKFLTQGAGGAAGAPPPDTAYQAGVWAGMAFGILMVIAGIFSIVKANSAEDSQAQ